MSDPSLGEIGGIFAGVVSGVIAIFKGIAWVINYKDARATTREAVLKQRELAADERDRAFQAGVQKQLEEMKMRSAEDRKHIRVLRILLVDVYTEVKAYNPESPMLERVRQTIRDGFEPGFDLDDTFMDLLTQINRETENG